MFFPEGVGGEGLFVDWQVMAHQLSECQKLHFQRELYFRTRDLEQERDARRSAELQLQGLQALGAQAFRLRFFAQLSLCCPW